MTKNEFIQHLEAPHYVNGEDIVGLQEVIKQFSYCQSAQLLLTKAFHESENLNFESQLKKSAAYAADRKRMHDLLYNNKLTHLASYPKPKFDEDNEPSDELNSSTSQSEALPVESTLGPALNSSIEVNQPSESEEVVSQHAEHTQNPTADALEQQILVEAINSSILLEVEKEENYTSIIEEEEDSPTPNVVNQFDDSVNHSFSDWLAHFKDEEQQLTEESRPSLWERTSEESKEMISAFSPDSTLPVKTEFYSPAKMARLSVQEDDDLVTETLATIYNDQGNFEKAISAYKKLQQKIPEKSSYFASRIKEIQHQLNS